MVPVAVIELDEAHAALGQPAGQQAVRGERAVAALGAVQVETSLRLVATGPSAPARSICMRKAISYWLMRVAISGIVDLLVEELVELPATASTTSRCRSVGHARRAADVEHRVALGAELDALEPARQKAAVPLPGGDRLRLAERARSRSARRSRAGCRSRLPRPYQSHEPIAGRPEIVVPVFMNVWAGSWLIASVFSERMMHISSATSAEVREDRRRSPGPTCRTS